MGRLSILLLLTWGMAAAPVWAQTRLPKASRDICAPIGKTADGQLVYAMECNAMPAPPPPVAAVPPPPPEPEVERSGIFGLSYTRKPPSQ